MHLNRKKAPITWPIPKKGTKYIAAGMGEKSIPLYIIIRDVMKMAETRKEVKKILNEKIVRVNGKIVRNEKYPLSLYDILSLKDKNYRIILKNKKFGIEETKETNKKVVKVIGKKILKGKKIQINLSDGRNYLVKEKIDIGDSVVIDLINRKIIEVLKFEKGKKVLVIKGKHIGKIGIIEEIEDKNCKIKVDGEKINIKKDYLMIIK